MKQHIIASFIITLLLAAGGCKTTGYNVRLETASLDYRVISQLETTLISRGYKIKSREALRYSGAAPNDVSTLLVKQYSKEEIIQGSDRSTVGDFQKKYNEERFWTVFITLSYLKDAPTVTRVNIVIYNHFIGGISPKIKAEIDSIGDLIYAELVHNVGKEHVKIERKEWGPPQFY
jgi:hypothetical protein